MLKNKYLHLIKTNLRYYRQERAIKPVKAIQVPTKTTKDVTT